MKLETLDQRFDLVKEMIDEGFAFQENVADLEDDNDWAGAMVTVENLAAVEDMICTEEIFMDTFNDMGHVRTSNRDEQEEFIGIFMYEGLNSFNETILLPRLRHTLEVLENWGFRTEDGVKFKDNFCEKLNALIKKYDGLYDI